ncbi:Alpha/Beta hydrolase protein [Aspergillus crustosus]
MSSLAIPPGANTTLHTRITRPTTPTNKPLVVFLHYWRGSSSTWHKVLSPDSSTAISSQYPTAAVDLRGWGKSIGPADETGRSYSMTAMAPDVATLVSSLKNSTENSDLLAQGFVLVGHSMGAKVALASLSALPDDLPKELKGLVLIAPAPPTALVLTQEMKEQQKIAYQSEDSVRWTVTNLLANTERLSEEDISLVVRNSLSGTELAKTAWPTYGMEEDITENVKTALASVGVRRCSWAEY